MTHTTPSTSPNGLSRPLLLLLSASTGLAVASIYYSQPMLGILGEDLHASGNAVGWIPTLTQLGYALGILLLAPLGDRYDRKHIILAKAAVLFLALLASALAPSIGVLLAASLAVGLTATVAQDIVPAAATLARPEHRGKVVGTVMTGLLLGILLSRVVSGFVAEQFGWRGMFLAAAASILALIAAMWRGLPSFQPSTRMSYGALLGSLATLWRQHGLLRRAAIAQGLLAVGFSAFWSTLAVMLHQAPFQLGAAAAGAFGLAGAAGALAAPMAGRIADRRGPDVVSRAGALLTALSFAVMVLSHWLSPHAALWLIGAAAIGFDLGIQVSLISHQTIVYGIDPAARSRLNAVLMTCVFIGMSIGGALGSYALARWGWMGVTALGTLAGLAALVLRSLPAPRAVRVAHAS
ncbi:transmembrane transport protein [Bordetella ansorpii]|uniref:Transmembrane transport protein n=1 Tax=Bordetella ansorpii TaxID=288768 RepID=A0A157P8T6_9BORD|nr:MFS transporter [Bordetella ansorpii]SAI29339.1 transmembrane transport protein [Bordetella ansorpii]